MKPNTTNSDYWNEMCGTTTAKYLGINDFTFESLKKFDDYYLSYYPYLLDKYIPLIDLRNKRILEIGLGYGTISQKLVEADSLYEGLDIADGPVNLVNERLDMIASSCRASKGDILNSGLEETSYDYIIAIGCLHHTGDLKRAINECFKLLKNGGKLIFMVYYTYSYRMILRAPIHTTKYFFKELFGNNGLSSGNPSQSTRGLYDHTQEHSSPPHTDFISKRSLKMFLKDFSEIQIQTENLGFRGSIRETLLNSYLSRTFGLDLYVVATKGEK